MRGLFVSRLAKGKRGGRHGSTISHKKQNSEEAIGVSWQVDALPAQQARTARKNDREAGSRIARRRLSVIERIATA